MGWEYTEKTKELFMNAMQSKEDTHMGEIQSPDAVGSDGSIVCGDALKLFFNVKKDEQNPKNDKITEIKYQTFGCTSAIASSEALCRLIEERQCTPIEALKITNADIVDFLGGLPDQKIHCSVMGAQALSDAVSNWANKRGIDLKQLGHQDHEEEDEGRIVCDCYNLTEPFLIKTIKELKLTSLDQVLNATKAGGACTSCQNRPGGINDILTEVWGKCSTDELNKEEVISPELKKQILAVVDEEIRPILKQHGGDIKIVEIKGKNIFCSLRGSCSSCAGAKFTLKNIVEKKLHELIDTELNVIDI